MILDTRCRELTEIKEQASRIWNPEVGGHNG